MPIESVMVVVLILTTFSWMASVILAIISAQKQHQVGIELNAKADEAARQATLAATQAALAVVTAATSAQEIGQKLDAIGLQANGSLTKLQEENKALHTQIAQLSAEKIPKGIKPKGIPDR